MPIRIRKDKGGNSNPRRRLQKSGSGSGGILGGLIGYILPLVFKKPKIFIPLLIVAGLVYYCSRSNDTASSIVNSVLSLSTGCEMKQDVYDEAEVFEPLADNSKNPLPEKISLLEYAPTRQNQGSQGSCVGWASAYAAQTILYAQAHDKPPNNTAFSPSYLYNQIALKGCQGSYLTKALEVMNRKGLVPFSKFSYTDESCNRKPSQDLLQLASNFKIKGFNRLTRNDNDYRTDLLAIKQNLSQNGPVVVGMMVGGSFMEPMIGKSVWIPTESDYSKRGFGGHAMCVIGYDDYKEGGSFQIMNSWGEEWGNKGIFWISYSDFDFFTKEAYGLYPLKKETEATGNEMNTISIGLKMNNGGYIKLINSENGLFKSDSKVKFDTEFKIEVTNNNECYTYILGEDTDLSSYVLFPYTAKHSPYCGITGTRLFPKDHSLYTDAVGSEDNFSIIISNQPLDYKKINQELNKTNSVGISQRLNQLLKTEIVTEATLKLREHTLIETKFKFENKNVLILNISITK